MKLKSQIKEIAESILNIFVFTTILYYLFDKYPAETISLMNSFFVDFIRSENFVIALIYFTGIWLYTIIFSEIIIFILKGIYFIYQIIKTKKAAD